jgi:hypothetical protein
LRKQNKRMQLSIFTVGWIYKKHVALTILILLAATVAETSLSDAFFPTSKLNVAKHSA